MADFIHKVTGVRVSVAEGKTLGGDWEPVEKPVEKPRRSSKAAEKSE